MNSLSALLQDIRENFADEETLIDQYTRIEGRTPLDVLCEKESRLEIVELLKDIDKYLDPLDRKILQLYVIDGKTQDEVALRMKITRQAVSKRLGKMSWKIAKHGCEIPHFDNYKDRDFLIKNSTKEIGSPHGCDFPFKYLEHINVGGFWGQYRGKPIWKSKSECRILPYLRKSFGDDKTVCSLCKVCKGV